MGGNSHECEQYKPFFIDCDIYGLDFPDFTPLGTLNESITLGISPEYKLAMLFISYDDFMKFIKTCGNPVKFVNC